MLAIFSLLCLASCVLIAVKCHLDEMEDDNE